MLGQATPVSDSVSASREDPHASWVPMITIALGQVLMSFNVASLPVALGGMVKSFDVPPTTIATGIVMYSMAVAGLVMLGAKLNQRYGAPRVFRVVAVMFGLAQVLMTFSPSATLMIAAQGISGMAGAALVPSLVALIANEYRGRQQATALGALGSARAAAGVAAFLIGGILGTYIGWRPVFGILIVLSALVVVLSFRLNPERERPDVGIDGVGVVLAALAVLLLSFGFNNLNRWGLSLALSGAPFTVLGLSPAPVMIVLGLAFGQLFLSWTHRRQAAGRTPLLALQVIDSPEERAAVYAMFSVVALEAALNFSVPLYIQIVQGRSPLATAVAMLPFNLSVFFAALFITRLYDRFTPRQIGRAGFVLCSIALLWLAFVVFNDWSELPVLVGLVLFGIGQGSLVTLVFNVLVTASPKELAGDVGSLRGTTNNLAAAVGTAVAGALLVGLLSSSVLRSLADHPTLPPALQSQVDLDSITFVSNDRLRGVMAATSATPEQVDEAIRVNTEARLRALKIGFLLMAALSLLTIIPAGRLPPYRPGEIPGGRPERAAGGSATADAQSPAGAIANPA